jgi:two-component system, NtrC family, response regulator AtoC
MLDTIMLVISDDSSFIDSVGDAVRSIGGLKVAKVAEIEQATSCDSWDRVALVLIHLKRSGTDSGVVRLLRMISGARRPVATLVVADQQDADQALSLLRLGVADYLVRPVDPARLAHLADVLTVRAREAALGQPASRPPKNDLESAESLADDQGDETLMTQVRRVAPQDATILLGGETGTGKTRLARRIHELSSRKCEPFVVINCGSWNAGRLESELFGHALGSTETPRKDRAGKIAEVGRGTLFLDEIDGLPMSIQPRLLRVVEDRLLEAPVGSKTVPVRARLIAASNRDLEHQVEVGSFRSDLYYRLNVIGFQLAPLRERRGDIPSLVSRFVAEFSANLGRNVDSISAPALGVLEVYDWPGNIRELRNTIERAVSLAQDREIQVGDLPEAINRRGLSAIKRGSFQPSAARVAAGVTSTLAEIKRDAELARITEALEKHSNNRLRAAGELGISRMTLYKKLYKYGLMHQTRGAHDAGV